MGIPVEGGEEPNLEGVLRRSPLPVAFLSASARTASRVGALTFEWCPTRFATRLASLLGLGRRCGRIPPALVGLEKGAVPDSMLHLNSMLEVSVGLSWVARELAMILSLRNESK